MMALDIERLALTLVHFVWQGLLLYGAHALGRRWLREAPPEARHLFSCATLAAMAVAPLLTYAWLDRGAVGAAMGVEPVRASGVQLWIVAAWLTGVLVSSLRTALGWAYLERMVRAARPLEGALADLVAGVRTRVQLDARVQVLISDAIRVPLAARPLRTVVLLPSSALLRLTPAHLEALLLHEFVHIRRHDLLINAVQLVVEALLFFHPVVWLVSSAIRDERELCCDRASAAHCGTIVYARALSELEALRIRGDLAVAANGGSLMNRIESLLVSSRPQPSRWRLPSSLVSLVACLALALSCVAYEAEQVATRAGAVTVPWLPTPVARWAPQLEAAAKRHGVDANLLAIVALVESRGDARARSPSGARGLMQIMPATAEVIAHERGLEGHSEERLDDVAYNVDLGAWLLARELERFGSVELAAAAYNGGERRLRAYLDEGTPLSDETERYRNLVGAFYRERELTRSPTLEQLTHR